MQNMTVKQLQEIATRKSLKFNSKTTKTELIALIEDANKKEPKAKTTSSPKTGEY